MSILENIVGQISSSATGGLTKPASFDLDDDTFAKLLSKVSNVSPAEEQNNMFSNLGAPAGFEIEPLDAPQSVTHVDFNPQNVEIKDLKIGDDYFSNLLHDNINVMNLAKKHATNAYNLFGKEFVDNLGELVK